MTDEIRPNPIIIEEARYPCSAEPYFNCICINFSASDCEV